MSEHESKGTSQMSSSYFIGRVKERESHNCHLRVNDKQMAAERFVEYWESRCELFGPKKYLLPMTLGGALQDDLEAIEDGMLSLLPRLDLSGRQLLYWAPTRRSRGASYSSESLVRVWVCLTISCKNRVSSQASYMLIQCCIVATCTVVCHGGCVAPKR